MTLDEAIQEIKEEWNDCSREALEVAVDYLTNFRRLARELDKTRSEKNDARAEYRRLYGALLEVVEHACGAEMGDYNDLVRSCETCNHYNVNTCWCSRYNDTTYSSNCSSYQAKE